MLVKFVMHDPCQGKRSEANANSKQGRAEQHFAQTTIVVGRKNYRVINRLVRLCCGSNIRWMRSFRNKSGFGRYYRSTTAREKSLTCLMYRPTIRHPTRRLGLAQSKSCSTQHGPVRINQSINAPWNVQRQSTSFVETVLSKRARRFFPTPSKRQTIPQISGTS